MRYYCTIFDKNYLVQGVALHNSLRRHSRDFVLYALCMDATAYEMIVKMRRADLVPVRVEDLLEAETQTVRERTSHGQFCWVCQPLICQYVLDTFRVDMVTYLEADSLFFSDPESLFEELGAGSASLVSHNYTPGFDRTAGSGKFCVQFNAFKNDDKARTILEYWKRSCFLYDKDKPRSYPGQTCLNDWPERYTGVVVIQDPGAGVAPWNIQRFKFEKRNDRLYVDGHPLIFYHYHQFARYEDGDYDLCKYPLSEDVVNDIYGPYVREIAIVEREIRSLDPAFTYKRLQKKDAGLTTLAISLLPNGLKPYARSLLRMKYKTYNIYSEKDFLKLNMIKKT